MTCTPIPPDVLDLFQVGIQLMLQCNDASDHHPPPTKDVLMSHLTMTMMMESCCQHVGV
jgi:hypothetical protein